mgnify:CR=1 FL=1
MHNSWNVLVKQYPKYYWLISAFVNIWYPLQHCTLPWLITLFCPRDLRGGILVTSLEPSSSARSPPGRIPSENITCFGSLRRLLPGREISKTFDYLFNTCFIISMSVIDGLMSICMNGVSALIFQIYIYKDTSVLYASLDK